MEQVTSHDDDSGGAACSDAYSVGGLAYDANSNLTRLVRWGPALFAGGDGAVQGGRGAWADALTYRYADGTNRLVRLDEYEDPALDGTPSENPSGHEHSAGYAGRFDYDAAGRVTRERSGSSGPAVRRQVKRYSAASLPVRLDVPAADTAHGGVRLEYRYDGAGQRVQEVVQALLGVDKGDPDPYYQKRVWLRHGDGRAAGVLDGDGRLVSWSLYGAGLAGRIEPGQDTPPDVGEATERAAADSAQAALERYAVAGALAEANQVHALGLSEAEVKQAAAGAVQAAESETRAAAEGSVSMAALASHDEIGGAYVAEAEAPLREALYGELVGLGVPEAAALTAATEAAKGAAAEGGTAAGLAVKPGGVAGYRWRYYHADHLGSVRAVTDGYGRVVEATDYYVFGLQMPGRVWRSDSETREGYTGHELDPETGLNYAGARYYDSALGRWHVIDPLWAQFPSHSPYNYSFNDPINYNDPDGKAPWLVGAIIGGAVEFGGQVATGMASGQSFSDAARNVDYTDVGIAVGVGAATGGLSAVKALGTAAKTGIAVAGSVGEGKAKASLGNRTGDYGVATAAIDAGLGVGGQKAADAAQAFLQNATEAGKGLQQTARRAERVNRNNPKPSRASSAAAARSAADGYGGGPVSQGVQAAIQSAVGGAAGSAVAGGSTASTGTVTITNSGGMTPADNTRTVVEDPNRK